MQYMALIYNNGECKLDPDALQKHEDFVGEMVTRGYFKSCDALQDPSTATCISVRNGKIEQKDGPFSETKEQLAGYYILECANVKKAIECAAKIPGAQAGAVELRPILPMTQTPHSE